MSIYTNIFSTEKERLAALYDYNILDTCDEEAYDDITALASSICDVPMSLITFIDRDRQWFKSKKGVDVKQTPLNVSFCNHTILSDELMIVEDTYRDTRFVQNPFVINEPNIRFYAGMPLVTPDGFALGTICVLDQSPRRLSESQQKSLEALGRQVMQLIELRKKNNELEVANQFNQRLISIIGHDLKAPMQSIKQLTDFFQKASATKLDLQKWVPLMSKTADDAIQLTGNLLEWGATQLKNSERENVNLFQLVGETIERSQHLFSHKGNKVINNIDDSITILVNPTMLTFIVRNLLVNANKFTSEGDITISLERTDRQVVLGVSDTGKGISADRLPALFSWSHKTSTKGTNGEYGSGIGLPIVAEFAEQMGGNITVESTPGKGSRFNITLPD